MKVRMQIAEKLGDDNGGFKYSDKWASREAGKGDKIYRLSML